MDSSEKSTGLRAELLARVQQPLGLRVLITALVLLAGYAGVYWPLSGRIAASTETMNHTRHRVALARDIERLQAEYRRFSARLAPVEDGDAWVKYMLAEVHRLPLKLVVLKAEPPRSVGPYRAAVLRIELEGTFHDLSAFLRWLETNDRLLRVDSVQIAPQRTGGGALQMHLVVLGLMG